MCLVLSEFVRLLTFLQRDILQQRVASGAQVKDTVTSFGDRPNTVEEITNCEETPSAKLNHIFNLSYLDFRERFKHYHVCLFRFLSHPPWLTGIQKKLSPKRRSFMFYESSAIVG
jgi:hypothetical protein